MSGLLIGARKNWAETAAQTGRYPKPFVRKFILRVVSIHWDVTCTVPRVIDGKGESSGVSKRPRKAASGTVILVSISMAYTGERKYCVFPLALRVPHLAFAEPKLYSRISARR